MHHLDYAEDLDIVIPMHNLLELIVQFNCSMNNTYINTTETKSMMINL